MGGAQNGGSAGADGIDWTGLVVEVCANTGWTWDAALDAPISVIWALKRHWIKTPPVNALVAGFLGYKPPAEKKDDAASSPGWLP